MPVLSATECISPAFRHTLRQMFQRFRFSFWLRMAVLGLFTGEIGGGGVGGSFPSHFPSHAGTSSGQAGTHPHLPWQVSWFTPAHIAAIVIVIGLFVIAFTLLFLYINSILRFVLFDAVVHGDIRIIDGWRKRRAEGRRFFVWQLLLALVGWSLALVCVGIPLLLLFTNHHVGFWFIDAMGIVVVILGALFWMLLTLALAVIVVLAKDFVVPIMALEGVGWQEGWHRLLAIARGHSSEYVLYFVMKIVLRIGAGIVHSILVFLMVLLLLVPVVIAIIGGVAVGIGAGTVVKALLITFALVAGFLLLAFLTLFSAFVGAPIAFFFPSYAIYFFAGRYEPLGRIVFPSPAPPPTFTPPPDAPPPLPA